MFLHDFHNSAPLEASFFSKFRQKFRDFEETEILKNSKNLKIWIFKSVDKFLEMLDNFL